MMYKEETELFEEALKSNMVWDASELIKSTYHDFYMDILVFNELEDETYPEHLEQIRSSFIKHFQDIANEYNFKFELNYRNGEIGYVKWYHNEKRIFPLNGVIKTLKRKIISKRNPINPALRHEAMKRDGFRCLECGATNTYRTLEVDHIIPVAQGGTDELNNLQTLCIICNRSKSNRAWVAGQI